MFYERTRAHLLQKNHHILDLHIASHRFFFSISIVLSFILFCLCFIGRYSVKCEYCMQSLTWTYVRRVCIDFQSLSLFYSSVFLSFTRFFYFVLDFHRQALMYRNFKIVLDQFEYAWWSQILPDGPLFNWKQKNRFEINGIVSIYLRLYEYFQRHLFYLPIIFSYLHFVLFYLIFYFIVDDPFEKKTQREKKTCAHSIVFSPIRVNQMYKLKLSDNG